MAGLFFRRADDGSDGRDFSGREDKIFPGRVDVPQVDCVFGAVHEDIESAAMVAVRDIDRMCGAWFAGGREESGLAGAQCGRAGGVGNDNAPRLRNAVEKIGARHGFGG